MAVSAISGPLAWKRLAYYKPNEKSYNRTKSVRLLSLRVDGALGENRTLDLFLTKEVLYH